MFAKGEADLGPRPRPFLDQESCKGSASHEGADTFATVAGELADKRCRDKKAAATLRKFEWFMSFALVAIGSWPSTTLLLVCGLDRPQGGRVGRIHQTARKLRTAISDVFRYAIATARPRAAIVSPNAFGGLLRAIEGYQGAPETIAALELLALTFVRPRELRAAEWTEFDLDAAVWEIPLERMKMSRPHRVSRRARGPGQADLI